MIRIVLVRHGETVWHAENRYAGSSDIALTPAGERQAVDLAAWAQGANLTHLVVSPLRRAQATIAPVANALGMAAQVEPGLRELDFGRGEGLTASEMRARFPEAYASFLDDPFANPLPGGESPQAAITRARQAIFATARQQGSRTADARILAVAHNTLIRLLLCDVLGASPSKYRKLFPNLANVSITEIGLHLDSASDPSSISLLQFNAPIASATAHTRKVSTPS